MNTIKNVKKTLRRWFVFTLVSLSFMCHLPVHAQPEVLGWLEAAYLLPSGIRLRAKLDTGARTSSIHAIDIEPYEKDGEPWVRFSVPYKPDKDVDEYEYLALEKPVIRETRIKEHVGESNTRYVVELEYCLNGKHYHTPFTLADRSNFHYPVLLGRLSLRNKVLVDPSRSFTANESCS